MLTQVYEISTIEEAAAISAIGVDHVGVLVGDGRFPRELPIKAASDIGAAINPPSKFSALFLNHDMSLIATWARELKPSIVHLGASAELLFPKDVALLKRILSGLVVMRSIPVFGEESIAITGMARESPRGPMSIDPETREVVHNVYIRRVERINGELYNTELVTFESVKDPLKAAKQTAN